MSKDFDGYEILDEDVITEYIQECLARNEGVAVKKEGISLVLDYYMQFLVEIGVAIPYEDD